MKHKRDIESELQGSIEEYCCCGRDVEMSMRCFGSGNTEVSRVEATCDLSGKRDWELGPDVSRRRVCY